MYSNPYFDTGFFGFLWVLLQRVVGFLSGALHIEDLASDELQLLVLIGVAVSGALVGTFLVLRRMTMLANSLSHTILVGIVITYLLTRSSMTHLQPDLQLMLLAALITGLLTAFLTEFMTKTMGLQADASIGLVFTTLFALGITLVTLFTRNAHIGAETVMGNVDALQRDDGLLIGVIVLMNLVLVSLFFRGYLITTFDPQLAKALGFSPALFSYLLMLQTSATCVGAFRAVGVLMVLAFITGPPLTARLLTNNLKSMLGMAMLLGSMAALIGVALSRHVLTTYGIGLSTGGLVVCTILALYVIAALFAPNVGLARLRRWRATPGT